MDHAHAAVVVETATVSLSKSYRRIDDAVKLMKGVTISDAQQPTFISSLYEHTALDRNVSVTEHENGLKVLPDTANNILRKNIYFLATLTKNVYDLLHIARERDITDDNDNEIIDALEDTKLKTIALFIRFIKKSATELPLSLLIEILTLSGNTETAKILSDNKPSASLTPAPAVVVLVQADPDIPAEGAVGGNIQVPQRPEDPAGWGCKHCTFINPESALICSMCSKSQDFKLIDSSQVCDCCTFINQPRATVCEICSTSLHSEVPEEYEDEWKTAREESDEEVFLYNPVRRVVNDDEEW